MCDRIAVIIFSGIFSYVHVQKLVKNILKVVNYAKFVYLKEETIIEKGSIYQENHICLVLSTKELFEKIHPLLKFHYSLIRSNNLDHVISLIRQKPVSCVIADLNKPYDCIPANLAKFKSRFSTIPLIGLFDCLNIELLTDYIKSGVDRVVEEDKLEKVISVIQEEMAKNCYIVDWKEYGIDVDRCPARMKAALKIIKEKYTNLHGVQEVAEEIGIASESLSRLFKNNIDLRPKHLITLLKVKHAIHLMSNTGLSIKEIATIVGYKNDRRFRENFKRMMGICPCEYGNITNPHKKSINKHRSYLMEC